MEECTDDKWKYPVDSLPRPRRSYKLPKIIDLFWGYYFKSDLSLFFYYDFFTIDYNDGKKLSKDIKINAKSFSWWETILWIDNCHIEHQSKTRLNLKKAIYRKRSISAAAFKKCYSNECGCAYLDVYGIIIVGVYSFCLYIT